MTANKFFAAACGTTDPAQTPACGAQDPAPACGSADPTSPACSVPLWKEQPSAIDDPTIKNGFYGAPTVCAVFAPKNFLFSVADAFCAAENMVLEATELGVSSCIISRGEETFSGEEGEAMLRDWNVPAGFIARCFVILGYCEGAYPQPKPRRAGRFLVVEQREQI